jgi:hypothetical protein
MPTDISDDGEWMVTVDDSEGPEYRIYLRRTDGSPAVLLGNGVSARLSPDGRHVLAGRSWTGRWFASYRPARGRHAICPPTA